MKVTYIGAMLNASGYSDAARNYVLALAEVGVEVEAMPLSFEEFSSDLGKSGERIRAMTVSNPQARVRIVHTVPSVFEQFSFPGAYNIGYTTWETSKLPKKWVENINAMDEAWVPSIYNYEVFKNSGVTVPVFIVPHTFNRSSFEEETISIQLSHIAPDDYVFYSIFQWTNRKDPLSLLKAYLTEFRGTDKVCLILKTYLFDPTNGQQKERLKSMIASIKDKLRMTDYPRIMFIPDLLSKGQINGLHRACSCYVSAHRAEGWGIPLCEAAMAGKPIICTDHGGSKDFINDTTGFPVKYQMTPVYDMPWEAYSGDQEWADIDIMDLRKRMRWVFENQSKARQVGMNAQRFVDENLSWSRVGGLMKNRLELIASRNFQR